MSESLRHMDSKSINRRKFLEDTAIGLVGVAFGATCPQIFSCSHDEKKSDRGSKPNILIIVSDDTGWNDVGYHGSEVKTPNIDRLSKEGVVFDYFYVHPVCSPTRAALLTGKPPSRYGITGPIALRNKKALPKDTITLAELLRKNGYDTAITGKWHLGSRPEVGPMQYGFNHSHGCFHGGVNQYTHFYKNGDRTWHRNDEYIVEEGHTTDLFTNEAIGFIKNKRDKSKPFFLYVAYTAPHIPLQEEEKWVSMYE